MKQLSIFWYVVAALTSFWGSGLYGNTTAVWKRSMGPNGASYVGLTASTTNPNVLYAGIANTGIARTTDGGVEWEITALPIEGLYDTIEVHIVPGSDSHIRVLAAGKYFESYNGGESFSQRSLPTTYPLSCLKTHPVKPYVLFIGGKGDGLFRSTTDGASWERVFSFGTVSRIEFSPRDVSRMCAVIGSELYRSIDTGTTWEFWSTPPGGANITAMKFDLLNVNRIYIAQAGTCFVSGNSGLTWRDVTTNAAGATIDGFVQDRSIPSSIWAYGSRLFVSTDVGTTWNVLDSSNTPYRGAVVRGNEIIAACIHDNLVKSVDGGATWFNLDRPIRAWDIQSLSVYSPKIWVVAGKNSSALTTNWGVQYTEAQPPSFAPTYTGRLLAFAAHPARHQTWFAATPEGFRNSSNAGATWSKPTLAGVAILALAADPQALNTCYVLTSRSLMVTTDGGTTFTDVAPNSWGATSLVAGLTSGTLAVYGDRGLSATANAGVSWQSWMVPEQINSAVWVGNHLFVAGHNTYHVAGSRVERVAEHGSKTVLGISHEQSSQFVAASANGALCTFRVGEPSRPTVVEQIAAHTPEFSSAQTVVQTHDGLVLVGTSIGLFEYSTTLSVDHTQEETSLGPRTIADVLVVLPNHELSIRGNVLDGCDIRLWSATGTLLQQVQHAKAGDVIAIHPEVSGAIFVTTSKTMGALPLILLR
jgi:hypothetical protein